MIARTTRALLRLTVRLLPSSMREEFGREIVMNGVREMSELGSASTRLRLLAFLVVDVCTAAAVEWSAILAARMWAFIEPRRAEAHWALRSMARGFRVPAVATVILAVGCAGAGTAGWMVVEAFRGAVPGLPGARTVTVWPGMVASPDFLEEIERGVPELERVEGSRHLLGLLGPDEEEMLVASVTAGYLGLAGGRMIRGGDTSTRHDEAIPLVLARSFWESAFASDPQLVGERRTLLSDSALTVEITGVYEPVSGLSGGVVGWLVTEGRTGWYYSSLIGRLAPRASLEESGMSLHSWADSMAVVAPELVAEGEVDTALVEPFHWPTLPRLRRALGVVALLTVGLFALTVGCVRVVVRPLPRRRRLAEPVARSLGSPIAGAGTFDRLVGALLAVFSIPGTVAAVLLLRVWLGGSEDPILGRELALGSPLAATALAGALAMVGALLSVPTRPGGGGGVRSGRPRRPRRLVALATVTTLAAVSTALAASIWTIRDAQLKHPVGFSPDGVTAARVRIDPEQVADGRSLLDHLRTQPGIERAALTQALPLSGERWSGFVGLRPGREDGEPGFPEDFEPAGLRIVSAGFFETLGVPLIRGRDFQEGEADVVAVSESLARALDPGGDLLGRSVGVPWDPSATYRVVAVVGDVQDVPPDGSATSEVYVPAPSWPVPWTWVVASGRGADPDGLAGALADVPGIRTFGPPLQLSQVVGSSRLLYESFFRLGGLLSLCSLLVSLVALLGVAVQSVQERSLELSLRQVLGAAPGRIAAEGTSSVLLALQLGGALGLVLLAVLDRSGLVGGVVGPLTAPGVLTATLLLSVALPGLLALGLSWIGTRRLSAVEVLGER